MAEYILTTINEELLAASAFLAQSGASLVSVNIIHVGVRFANCGVGLAGRRLVRATVQR
jgi:hypothetical protein